MTIVLLAALVVFSLPHVGDARRFARLLEQAEPQWVLFLPLLPGVILARRDRSSRAPPESGDDGIPDSSSPGASLPALLERLRSSRDGLTTAEATARLAVSGANAIEPKRARTALGDLVRSVASPLALILLAAAVASAFLGEAADAVIIAAMVLLSAGINFWQSSRSARAVRRLQTQVTPTATVLRDGAWTTIPRRDVVAGDVIQLSAGDLVPADARLIESADLHVQQAALTGESLPAEKMATAQSIVRVGPDARELVFVGTSVVSGTATAVAFATGARTAFGDIAARLAARPEETEFERGSRRFGMLILQTVTFLVLFILIVSIAMGRDAFQSLLFAVALAVGLTPEYLPMVTTVTLARGAARMARQKVIVKHLASIQNLGSIDVLCSDKTGTLTSGKMTLDASLDPLGRPSDRALFLGRLNSTFETGVKSALDAAILEHPVTGADGYRKVAEVPFDFERRRLSVVVERDHEPLLVTKGAPESVLSRCTGLEVDGQARELDEKVPRACLERFQTLSADGYHVLAVAYRTVSAAERAGRDQERDLVLVGFLTFADQLLKGVDQAIASLRDAPSLHGADVGISVAGAVDVAQEASDILLLEKRLDVLHAGIVAGRRSFANVLKYLLMGTSSNFGNMLSMAGAVFFLPFLPMRPTQILVNNFLYDLAQVTIPTDNVDPAYVRSPQRWDIRVIRTFMLFIGPVSSFFDFVTFGALLLVFRFGESLFQTGWFIESLATQVLVLLVIRTTGRPWTNRPSVALAVAVIAVVIAGLVLPYTPLAAPLGMTPPPPSLFLFVGLVVPTYLILVELLKGRVIRSIVSARGSEPASDRPRRCPTR